MHANGLLGLHELGKETGEEKDDICVKNHVKIKLAAEQK